MGSEYQRRNMLKEEDAMAPKRRMPPTELDANDLSGIRTEHEVRPRSKAKDRMEKLRIVSRNYYLVLYALTLTEGIPF